MNYSDKLKDPRWRAKRNSIIERDNGICQDCGLTSENIEVHHLAYNGDPWEVDDEYLITLCDRCHFYRHHSAGRTCETLSIGELIRMKYHG